MLEIMKKLNYVFKADTIEELAQKIVNKYYENIKMDPKTLADTVNRYNSFVAAGKDGDWGKTTLTVDTVNKHYNLIFITIRCCIFINRSEIWKPSHNFFCEFINS